MRVVLRVRRADPAALPPHGPVEALEVAGQLNPAPVEGGVVVGETALLVKVVEQVLQVLVVGLLGEGLEKNILYCGKRMKREN